MSEPTELDWARFYVDGLRHDLTDGADQQQLVGLLEALLRDARVGNITGSELAAGAEFYATAFSVALEVDEVHSRSIYLEGLQHGIALAAGMRGERGWVPGDEQ